jgi:hypothetical protein
MFKPITMFPAIVLFVFISTVANAHVTGTFVCKSTSGASSTSDNNYETYLWAPKPFGILIHKNGSMEMLGEKIPDFAKFNFVAGNAFGSGYYGRSTYSSFLLEPDGRFLFVQAMPFEAYMLTGLCKKAP